MSRESGVTSTVDWLLLGTPYEAAGWLRHADAAVAAMPPGLLTGTVVGLYLLALWTIRVRP